MIKQTASQTVGPFFHDGLVFGTEHLLIQPKTQGQRIWLRGQVFDGDGLGVPDALLEIWQADHNGIYPHPNDPDYKDADPHFGGFGRCATNKNGEYSFYTILPGTRQNVPYINLRIFSRGLLIHAVTRMYFLDNHTDLGLQNLSLERQKTLIATRAETPNEITYRFDIRLQGQDETVFFDF